MKRRSIRWLVGKVADFLPPPAYRSDVDIGNVPRNREYRSAHPCDELLHDWTWRQRVSADAIGWEQTCLECGTVDRAQCVLCDAEPEPGERYCPFHIEVNEKQDQFARLNLQFSSGFHLVDKEESEGHERRAYDTRIPVWDKKAREKENRQRRRSAEDVKQRRAQEQKLWRFNNRDKFNEYRRRKRAEKREQRASAA
jgi:hypothetical protein